MSAIGTIVIISNTYSDRDADGEFTFSQAFLAFVSPAGEVFTHNHLFVPSFDGEAHRAAADLALAFYRARVAPVRSQLTVEHVRQSAHWKRTSGSDLHLERRFNGRGWTTDVRSKSAFLCRAFSPNGGVKVLTKGQLAKAFAA